MAERNIGIPDGVNPNNLSHPPTILEANDSTRDLTPGINENTRRRRDYWTDSSNIEMELGVACEKFGHFPTQDELSEAKLSSLKQAITKTGGANFWRQRLGFEVIRRDNGYWTVENIERDTRTFVSTHGGFSEDLAVEHGDQALYGAANSKFPGGIHSLKEKIGAKNKRRKAGSWTQERVLKEARDFVAEHGKFTSEALVKSGRYDLLNAVHNVSGGVRSVREQLGLQQLKKPDGYWDDLANVEKEAADYFEANGHIISTRMRLTHPSLVAAIWENYPGGFAAIRAKLQRQVEVNSATADEVFGEFFDEQET